MALTEEQIRDMQRWTKNVVDAGEAFCGIAMERCESKDDVMWLIDMIFDGWLEGQDDTEGQGANGERGA